MDFPNGGPSYNPDHPAISHALPGQPQNQRLELPTGKTHAAIAWPELKPPLIQTTVRQPDAVTVMHQHLQAVPALVGKEIGMVRLRLAEDPDDLGQDRFGYIGDGQVPIYNNWIENRIRPIAMGRKNWLFTGSLRAGKRAAAIMSLIQSAKLNGHAPFLYLKDILSRLPTQPKSRIGELLLHRWLPDASA